MKPQFEDFKGLNIVHSVFSVGRKTCGLEEVPSDITEKLQEKIQALNKELQDEKKARGKEGDQAAKVEPIISRVQGGLQPLQQRWRRSSLSHPLPLPEVSLFR